MKLLNWLYLGLLPVIAFAQVNQPVVEPEIQRTSENVLNIIAKDPLQSSSKELADLEDKIDEDFCPADIENNPSCEAFAQTLMPLDKKKNGWRTLFEIKYQNIHDRERRSTASANYRELDFGVYRNAAGKPEIDLTTGEALEQETQDILNWYKTNRPWMNVEIQDIRTQLILDQLTNPKFNTSDAHMEQKIKAYSANMNSAEYLRFMSSVAGWVDYNDERANFLLEQNDQTRGIVTPFQQMMGSKYGVCGDIHSMVAKMAEQKGWEAFTIGYSLESQQHVVTAVHDPKDPNKLMIVNYGRYEEIDLKNGKHVTPTPTTEGWEEMGSQLRIFKNDKYGNNEGAMKQIATVPTALGTFMNDLFVKDYQASRAMVGNQNYSSKKLTVEHDKDKVKIKKDGDKVLDRTIGEGIIIYEGETENAKIYGVGVSFDVFKQIYRFNRKTQKCEPKKSKYFSANLAGSLIDLKDANFNNTFYAYLNIKGGQIIRLYETEFFQFKGIIGYELDGFVANYEKGFLSGDGNFTTLAGVMADYEKKGLKVHSSLTLENNIGLKNQHLMNDFGAYDKNMQMGFNALKFKTDVTKQLNNKTALTGSAQFTGTKVGSQLIFSTGIIHKNTSVNLSYQGGMKSMPIGNHLQNVNLLQNMNNSDGFRLGVTQNFSNRSGKFSGQVSGFGGMSTSTPTPNYFFGGGVKLNLNNGKKRKPASP
jgi:hypothetical protein